MAVRITTTALLRRMASPAFLSGTTPSKDLYLLPPSFSTDRRISNTSILCSPSQFGNVGRKASSRLSQVQLLLLDSEESAKSAAVEPPPKLRLEHVSLSFAKSLGPGVFNKDESKVEMRFNVKKATWLSDRLRDKMLILAKSRINKEGEIFTFSNKTRTQQGNIEDCLKKLQAIIDAAAYVPPPLSEELKKKIEQIAAESEEKRLQAKKGLSQKKQLRRSQN